MSLLSTKSLRDDRGSPPSLWQLAKMGTFAETANVHYRYCLPNIYIQTASYIYIYVYISTSISICMYICCLFKRKTDNGSPGDFP
jgi:hypothetical protein